jgi:hypothetical protein
MALSIKQRQKAVLAHRMRFWGQLSNENTVSWRYEGRPWLLRRPADGEPPARRTVQCDVCTAVLEYRIHSVLDTRRRQARWRTLAYSGVAVLLVGIAGFFFVDSGSARFAVPLVAVFLGVSLGWVCGLAAAGECGVTGHGTSWPGATKHSMTLVETPDEDMPELVCDRCGHRTEFPFGSQLRRGYVSRQYELARKRFAEHECV